MISRALLRVWVTWSAKRGGSVWWDDCDWGGRWLSLGFLGGGFCEDEDGGGRSDDCACGCDCC